MNFFEQQDRSRKNTARLVFMFFNAVVVLIILTNLLVMVVIGYVNGERSQSVGGLFDQMDWQLFAAISGGVCIVVLAGSLYKIMVLSGGGETVAEALGGKQIPHNTDDLKCRQLLNVVEEMAIASGIPTPTVYLLADEPGINAFAAGFTSSDAVIGVTQGAVDHFSRDQMQGVIAHEFSHIFNGDMRLNIRLIGVLHGILIIGLIGYYILRYASYSRSSRKDNKKSSGVIFLGLGLMVIGYAGTFFGSLIKAAVSRQREYLADASAVQFTRNPDGIAGALKTIGGLEMGSKIENPGASEISHAFFAQGISGAMQSLSATHPPLIKRILRIDPHWDKKFITSGTKDTPRVQKKSNKQTSETPPKMTAEIATVIAGAALSDALRAVDQIGNPSLETIAYARQLISEFPDIIKNAAREPFGARAVIYSLVLNSYPEVRNRQLKLLQSYADPDVMVVMNQLMPEMSDLDIKFRLPLIEMVIPSLKQLSISQYKVFRNIFGQLIKIDSKVDMLEWSMQKILLGHLDGHFFKLKNMNVWYSRLNQLQKETALILSAMASAGHLDQIQREKAFIAAKKSLKLGAIEMVAHKELKTSKLDLSLEKLVKLKPLDKQRLLQACITSALYDQKLCPDEMEMLRAFSTALECPIPPVPAQ